MTNTLDYPGEHRQLRGKNILIIEDDPLIARVMERKLKSDGAEVILVSDGHQGFSLIERVRLDLIILDIVLPSMNGWHILRRLRESSTIPVIIVSASGDDESIIRGLNDGAVDYIAKPFSPSVFLARIRSALRQTGAPTWSGPEVNYDDGYLQVDLRKRRVRIGNEPVHLTRTEFGLLAMLLQSMGQTVTYHSILTRVWGKAYTDSIDYVHVYMCHLRRKLEKDPDNPFYFQIERGVGYRFVGRKPN